MTPENTYRISRGLKVLGLVAWTVVTIAVCAHVWNTKPGAAWAIMAAVLLVANIAAAVVIFRSLPVPEIEDWHLENPVEAAKEGKKK